MLEKFFALREHGTTVRTELIAGLTTFLTMAYIIFVNPSILEKAGMDHGAVFVATCIAAAIGSLIMGVYANLPVGLAPGMGLNAFFTFTIVLGMGKSWQMALACVFCSGVLFILISLFKIREALINSIPVTLRRAIAAGIGGFLLLIAMKGSGIVVANPDTLVSLGNLTQYLPAMTLLCFFLIITLQYFKVPGGVLLGMLITTIISLMTGHTHYSGIISLPPSIAPTFMQMDFSALASNAIEMLSIIFAFFFVDLFDTAGTLVGVTNRAGLIAKDGSIPNLKRALLADSSATVIGATLGTSNTTSFIESAAGVAAGGRTGLTSVFIAGFFLLALFFSPLASMVPLEATSGAILYVSILMMYALGNIDWGDISEAAPAAITVFGMTLTYSISDGITLGFISYAVIKALTGRAKEVNIGVWIVAAILFIRMIMMVQVFGV